MSTKEQETLYATNLPFAGGWSKYEKLTQGDEKVFKEAIGGIIGVKYTPNLVSRQIVAGMNYRFKCTARPVTPASTEYEAIVQIYAPLKGKPFITHIYPSL